MTARIGLIARAENRGLGNMTWEFSRAMHPDKTLIVIPEGVRHAHLESHIDRYPGASVVRFDRGGLPEDACREWLTDLDICYSAETYYDWRFCRWASEQRVATVCHLMPEWLPPGRAAEPSEWWAPTSWRLDTLPEGTKHVPVPIATDRFPARTTREPGPFRWLHVAGAETHADRNGTQAVLHAARLLTGEQTVTVRTQTAGLASSDPRVRIDHSDVPNYWDAYTGFDAMVMPRRYAGLCLPVLEAFGAGLPVVMTDMLPQRYDWPACLVKVNEGRSLRMMGGRIPTADADVHDLAEVMNNIAHNDNASFLLWQDESRLYAEANSWTVRAPQIRAELERVADRITV